MRAALIRGIQRPTYASLFRRDRDCYHRQSRYTRLGNGGYGYSSIVVITTLRPHCHSAVCCAAIVRPPSLATWPPSRPSHPDYVQMSTRAPTRATSSEKRLERTANKYTRETPFGGRELRARSRTELAYAVFFDLLGRRSSTCSYGFTSRDPLPVVCDIYYCRPYRYY